MLDPTTPLGQCTFVAFDTETTGTGAGARLVEIAGSRFRGDEHLGTFELLIDPGVPIPPEAAEVHRITDDMVRGKPKAPAALREFFAFAEGAVLVAHNAAFDAAIVGLELTRARLPAPRNVVLDTLKASRRLYSSHAHSLDALMAMVGLPPQDARHRALADAELVRHLVRKMCESLGGDHCTVAALVEHAGPAETLAPYVLAPPRLPFALQILEKACKDRTKVNLHVDAGGARPQQRIVHPELYYEWNGAAWLEAFCPEDGHSHCFRLDRIVKAEPGASSGFLF